MATPVKVVREMLVDDDDGGTALEMQVSEREREGERGRVGGLRKEAKR
jgi:hypothetical protein